MNEPKKVLVVEDEAIIALDIEMRLKLLGFSTSNQTATCKTAAEKIEKIKPDLLILDIMLKDGPSGFDIAKIAKAKKIPYIFITASTDAGFYEKANALKPVSIIEKPVSDEQLKEALSMVFLPESVREA